jgi:fused signal recognition particle receptor
MFNLLKDKLKSWLGKKNSKPTKKIEEKSKKITKTPKKIREKIEKKDKEIREEKPIIEIESQKIEVKEEKRSFLSRLTEKFTSNKVSQEQIDEIFSELEIILLENNIALEAVDKIKETMISELLDKEIKKSDLENKIIESIKKGIESIMTNPPNLINEIKSSQGVYTILFFGINGSGKTTSIAKLAYKLKKEGISVALAAGDTFRAAAVEQLETHAQKIGIPIIKSQYGSDPTSVAFDAKQYSQKHSIKCLLIDTAGRMYTKENLIKQMEKLIRVIQPNKKIFVGESTTGNDMIDQAKTFDEALKIDGIILSKADVDEKGGTALSISYVTKKPIYFIGVGQNYADLKDFKKEEMIKNIGI